MSIWTKITGKDKRDAAQALVEADIAARRIEVAQFKANHLAAHAEKARVEREWDEIRALLAKRS